MSSPASRPGRSRWFTAGGVFDGHSIPGAAARPAVSMPVPKDGEVHHIQRRDRMGTIDFNRTIERQLAAFLQLHQEKERNGERPWHDACG
eukprot:2907915-Pleurochrysis_carterae.AAC.1